jgi:phosphonate metabolism-associated iron-containing alcohol dehydrogenase
MTDFKVFQYHNPVQIEFGIGALEGLRERTGNRKILVVTSKSHIIDPFFQSILKSVSDKVEFIINDVKPNPIFSSIKKYYETIKDNKIDLVLGYGGGSVLDTAKVLSLHSNSYQKIVSLIKGEFKSEYVIKPLILIPTTAGSGSELTPWATVWDDINKKKYSLHLPDLWAEWAICDPRTQLSLPVDVTIQSGLDALSHAIESVWNINSNPISTNYARIASDLIFEFLPALIKKPSDIQLRSKIQFAAVNAGLAFSNTRTSMAHAISYYLTLHKGTPHGIACSVPLPLLLDFIEKNEYEMAQILHKTFSVDLHNKLKGLLQKCNISSNLEDYSLDKSDFRNIREQILSNQRAQNFIGINSFIDYWNKKWDLQS